MPLEVAVEMTLSRQNVGLWICSIQHAIVLLSCSHAKERPVKIATTSHQMPIIATTPLNRMPLAPMPATAAILHKAPTQQIAPATPPNRMPPAPMPATAAILHKAPTQQIAPATTPNRMPPAPMPATAAILHKAPTQQ